MLQLRKLESLDGADFGWLRAKHHFAVSPDGNAAHAALGSLMVWNDDEIAPRTGFPLHGHRNTEIVTYVREGVLEHSDTLGIRQEITAGSVQAFTAGVGIRHAERNAGDGPLRIFQIWLRPTELDLSPRWATKAFSKLDRDGRFVALASGFEQDEDAVTIHADARVLGAVLKAGHSTSYDLATARYAYLVVAKGAAWVNGQRVNERDGLAISQEKTGIDVTAIEDSELLLVDAA
jgi:quercetin 2,3-dioxygenase